MKNMKRSLVALMALVSASSFGLHPMGSVNDNAPFGISVGLMGGFKGVKKEKEDGLGLGNLGVGLGFTHKIADFQYGLSVALNRSGIPQQKYGIFMGDDDYKKEVGLNLSAGLMTRYMPEIAEGFRLGAALDVGFGRQLTLGRDKAVEDFYNEHGFGDLSVRLGPAMSYSFGDAATLYFAPAVTMSNIRFGSTTDKALETKRAAMNNWIGAAAPVGAWFGVSDSIGLSLQVEPRIANFKPDAAVAKGAMELFQVEGTLGVTFAL